MSEYKEISYEEYWDLQDRTGAYLVLYSGGTKEWYLNGKRHREDGPAIEYSEEDKEWYLHGERHREDGPAVEWGDGDKEWYLHGKRYETEEEWAFALYELKIKEIKDLVV